ncbi:MAG TPA: hypothetical protein VM509_01210 [Planctomycetota bacterium]|nr:hypothetical protein [Planctomycetota bacterium]
MHQQLVLGLLFLSLGAAVANAQTPCHAEYDGNVFSDNVSMGGPNLIIGIKFVAPSAFSATSIEVFTGEGGGQNSVQIWSHDAALNQPLAQLSSGSWSMSSANSWQGAALASPVALTSGATYWLGWAPINGAQASVDTSIPGNGQSYRGSFDGGQTWSGPFQGSNHWKFRIFGGCNTTTVYCTAKVNSLGCTPVISAVGSPSPVASSGFVVHGANVRNQKVGILLYSVTGRAATPFQNGFLCVAAPVRRTPSVSSAGNALPANDCSGDYALDMNAFGQGALGGSPSPALLVPGTVVDCQWWGRDQGFAAPNNSTLTDAIEYVL